MVYIGELYTKFLLIHVLMCVQTGVPCKWTSDSKLFILETFETIQDSPSQIYYSALPHCPSSSWLHEYYSAKVKMVVGATGWGTCIRTVSCQEDPYTLAYWNNTIAACSDHDIIVLSALTGSLVAILSGHTDHVLSLAFSSDGVYLVSGSFDETIRLWDVQTGGVIKALYSHTKTICSVSISANNTTIASGSHDNAIRLWNIETGNCLVIEGCKGYIKTVNFSPTNPQLLLSSISNDTVQQWGINGDKIGPPITGSYAVFSPDGTQFVSSNGKTVTIRNTDSGKTVAKFNLTDNVHHCCFSLDGRFIAVHDDHTIYLWDVSGPKPHPIQTLTGHTALISSLVFSPSFTLISASFDRSIKFWQIGGPSADLVVPASARIVSVSLQTKEGLAFSIDSEGVVKTWDILTGCCKETFKSLAKDILHADIQTIDNNLVIVWCEQGKNIIRLWDSGRNKPQAICEIENFLGGLRITGDGSRVLWVEKGSVKAKSMWTKEPACEGVLWSDDDLACLDPFRMDGSKVLVSFQLAETQGWDFGNPGSTPIQFSGTSSHLSLVGGQWWTTGGSLGVQDSVTGKEVFKLCGKYAHPSAEQWDGQYLIAGYYSGEVLILDFGHILS